jgi:hypothetical protein
MQTITLPMLRTGRRLVAVALAAIAVAVVVTVFAVYYAGGSTPGRTIHSPSSAVSSERCFIHRPC